MKFLSSKATLLLIISILTLVRIYYSFFDSPPKTNVLTWDAFGYYTDLPGLFIYHDIKEMNWVDSIQSKYHVTGNLYQLSDLPNGNRAMKYLLGIPILNSPFFVCGHIAAGLFHYTQDGFSLPYQWAISLSALFYALIGLLFLRKILLFYFRENIVSLTLVLLALGTNYIQYVSIDSAMSHGYLFALYAIILFLTVQWHAKPKYWSAFIIGFIIGLAAICRPTDGIMLFIPVLYNVHARFLRKEKWTLIKKNQLQLLTACAGILIGVLPQLIYWKYVTGGWIYDVGSKFTFFDPHWRVLFGWEKGWFIYTPLAILMVVGLFFIKKNPFYIAILVFSVLNIWIIIAWSDWRYGASYSARAMVQSYAVLSIPLAAALQKILNNRYKEIVLTWLLIFLFINLFQVWQYNKTILHYNDMNFKYYRAIFLNPKPTPLQMSLLDTKDYLANENNYTTVNHVKVENEFILNVARSDSVLLYSTELNTMPEFNSNKERWLKISSEIKSDWGAYNSFLISQFKDGKIVKTSRCRLQNAICKNGEWNKIEYYFEIPDKPIAGRVNLWATTTEAQDIYLKNVNINFMTKFR